MRHINVVRTLPLQIPPEGCSDFRKTVCVTPYSLFCTHGTEQKNAVRRLIWLQGNSSSWQRKLMIVSTILNPNIVLSSIRGDWLSGLRKVVKGMEWGGGGVAAWSVIASRDLPGCSCYAHPPWKWNVRWVGLSAAVRPLLCSCSRHAPSYLAFSPF